MRYNLMIILFVFSFTGCSNITKKVVGKNKEKFKLESFVITDNFDRNEYGWIEDSDDSVRGKIENGYFNIEHFQEGYNYRLWQDFNFKKGKIYVSETKMRYENGELDSNFGIFFGTNTGEEVALEINNLGQVSVYYDYKEKTTYFIDNKYFGYVIKNDWNYFRFITDGEKVVFSLNGFDFGEITLNNAYINKLGFIVNDEVKINIDYVKCNEA